MSTLLVAGASIYVKLTVVGAMFFGMSARQVEIQVEEGQKLRIEKLEKPEPKLIRPKK
jgi:hypothetical protein